VSDGALQPLPPSRSARPPALLARARRELIAMSPLQQVEPRQYVPASQPSLALRLRDIVLSPNAVRIVSVAVFFAIWEYCGRRMDPIFMAPPSAILQAAVILIRSGALQTA